MRRAGFPLISIGLGILAALFTMELALRFLPVNEGARPQAVDQDHPVRSLEPDRTFVWSADWNFAIVNTVRTNNLGFVNDQDYLPGQPSPLLALIGDSYVEALMVPFRDSVAGRLSARSTPAERIYSFGTSSSALSNYLAYADYAAKTFHPQAMIFLIIGNDFDESLVKYKNEPGHSYFAEDGQGPLALRRIDYHPSLWRRIIRASALVRYVTLNTDLLNVVLKWQHLPFGRPSNTLAFVGNTGAQANPLRIADAQRAVDTFLTRVTEAAGLPPDRILFAVDGMRPHIYNAVTWQLAAGSYFDIMRQYFMTHARQGGFEVLDLQPRFAEHFSQHHRPLEFATDNHWNSLGHEVVEEAIAHSSLYGWFHSLVR
ncbi:MAG: hypothetical protein LZF60_380217 [Nitrospira sp.]|nr:MAG: hypothetical protein LZF60_380217 [Nitrospira sp.]